MDPSGLYISADAVPRKTSRKLPFEVWLLLVLILCLTLGLASLVFLSRESLDGAGWTLVSGAFILAVILAAGVFNLSRKQVASKSDSYVDAVFAEHSVPFVITEGERPFAANKTYLKLFGVSKFNEALQTEVVPPIDTLIKINEDEDKQALYRLHNLRADAAAETADFFREAKDGTLIPFQLRVSGLGEAKLWEIIDIPVFEDVSPLFDAAPIGMMSITPEGEIIAMNEALQAWVGDDLKAAARLAEILDADDMFTAVTPEAGRKIRGEASLKTTAGVDVPVVLNANWVKLANGRLIAVAAIHGHSNIQTQKPQQTAAMPLAAAGSDNHMNTPMAALEIDNVNLNEAALVKVNAAFKEMFGASPARGDDLSTLLHLSGGEDISKPIETRLTNTDNTPVSLYVAPNHELSGGAHIYIIDISTRRSLETQLSQSQKMQAIGQLAAGVAHDFNNLLQAMRLSADDLLGRHPIGDPSYADLQSINSTINRSAALVKKLLAFSRQQTLRPEVLDLGEALSDRPGRDFGWFNIS